MNPKQLPLSNRRDLEYLAKQQQPKIRSKIHQQSETYQAGVMGLLGMSTKAIANTTGLRPHQITYRLNRTGVKRTDYRNGTSPVAQFILKKARDYAQEKFVEQLREKLNLVSP